MDIWCRIISIYLLCVYLKNGFAARLPVNPSHSLLQNNDYLPPAFMAENYDNIRALQSYQTKQQLEAQTYKPLTSYAPPASGAASFQYSTPQKSNEIALSMIIPKALLDEKLNARPIERFIKQQAMESKTLSPILIAEEPASFLLTPNQNKTVQAAKLFDSLLLDPNTNSDLEQKLSGEPNAHTTLDPNQLNTTDVVIVKAQKNAYIIPKHLAEDTRNPQTAQALYEMREQLGKAYTINQYIFIIKPEKINFLNKLL